MHGTAGSGIPEPAVVVLGARRCRRYASSGSTTPMYGSERYCSS
jgi:hypothetical protein